MGNAAIYLNPEAYNTGGKQLMGRHSAGESFLRGFIRHGDVDQFYFWNVADRPGDELEAFARSIEDSDKPITWLSRGERGRMSEPGCVYIPTPQIAREAWSRQILKSTQYCITGVTHTTATAQVMDALANLLLSPLEPWDALICTSRAVQASVETQLESLAEHLRSHLGARRVPTPRLETIPLGINSAEFEPRPQDRKAWRERLDIPEDAVVALYVGRFNLTSKMNPIPMAIALERAAKATGKPIYWVVSGWSATDELEARYHEISRAACPSVHYRTVDGRKPEARFSIWAVGDFFLSLSDNVQETFGLTPLEAMAAGLPSVVSDWDGYKDTVRHETDGFRIPTYTPRPGLGVDLAYRFHNLWDVYDMYVGATSQFTSIDLEAAEHAIVQLVQRPELRRRMGVNAKAYVAETFDWAQVIPRYQALWGELNALRLAAAPGLKTRNTSENPWRLDPFELFSSYPTEHLTPSSRVKLAAGVDDAVTARTMALPHVRFAGPLLPRPVEVEQIMALVGRAPEITVREITDAFLPSRRLYVERGLLFLAKYGLLTVLGRSHLMPK